MRANLDLTAGDWPAAAARLEGAERLAPKGLAQGRVDQAWRNAQRELLFVKLRRALALWRDGRHEKAVDLATIARTSDEEYVRAAATLLLAAADLRGGRRPEALARLRVLRGHDVRFAEPTRALEAAVAEDHDPAPAVGRVREALGAADRSLAFVTAPVADALLAAASAPGSRMAASGEGPAQP